MAERRRTFGPVVLLGLASGTLTAVAGEKPAVHASGQAATAVSSRLVSFDAHLPLVTALGLVVLACWGVLLVTRGRVRRAVAVLAAIAAVGAVVSVVATALAVRWAPEWPEMGSRYDAPAGERATPEAVDPAEQSSLDLWKAMDEGRDPTAGPAE